MGATGATRVPLVVATHPVGGEVVELSRTSPKATDQTQLRELRHDSADSAQKIHVKASQLLGCVASHAAVADTPAFVPMLKEQERRTRYMQEVCGRRISFIADRIAGGGAFVAIFR